jgi:hypothetical protein
MGANKDVTKNGQKHMRAEIKAGQDETRSVITADKEQMRTKMKASQGKMEALIRDDQENTDATTHSSGTPRPNSKNPSTSWWRVSWNLLTSGHGVSTRNSTARYKEYDCTYKLQSHWSKVRGESSRRNCQRSKSNAGMKVAGTK